MLKDLKVTEGRNVEHFFKDCALDSVSKVLETLKPLSQELKTVDRV